jgi:Ca2+-binding RTX toxin-like protein
MRQGVDGSTFALGTALVRLEALETRRLFAAIESGILVAQGTDNADTISLRRTGTDDVIVTTNGVNQAFDMDDFTGVRLEGLGGNDTFNLIDPLTSPVVRNTTVLGGAGNDTVSYAARTAALDFTGITERDPTMSLAYVTMTSGAQVDRIAIDVESYKAGSGDDRFVVGVPNSSDLTGKIRLTFDGGEGADLLFSGQYVSTTLIGGAGNDSFSVNSESGTTDIFGGDGDDSFSFNDDSVASIDAGAGIDTLNLSVVHAQFNGTFDMRNYPGLENVDGIQFFLHTVIGNDLDNRITLIKDGDATSATVLGLGGNDTLISANGNDSLDGGEGNDSLIGGTGNDTLNGGNGTDFGDGGAGTNTLISIENGPGSGDPTSPSIAITGGVLVANGTGGNDTFSIRRVLSDDVTITVNITSKTFYMDDFTGVRLVGFGGNDSFNMIDALTSPVVRNTTVLGGAGSDTISYATRTAALNVTVDPARGIVASGAQTDDFLGVETIIGGSGNDTYQYGNFVEIPPEQEGQQFAFRVEGRGGNDTFEDHLVPTLDDNFAIITLFGGDGDDRFSDDENPDDQFFGEAGNDTLNLFENSGASGGTGIDTMSVVTFDDTVDMRFTPDVENLSRVSTGFVNPITVIGNDLSNRIDLSQRGDPVTVQGLGGNDTITGSDWDDSLDGGEGNDSLVGGPGNDTLNGGNGTDFADGDGGQNTHISIEQFAGGGGGTASIAIVNRVLTATGTGNDDTITIKRVLTDDVTVKVGSLSKTFDMDDFDGVLLQGLGGNDFIEVTDEVRAGTLSRKVTLQGGTGDDWLYGSDGDEVIRGGDGVDTLWGLPGDDALFGDAGNDTEYGGTGADFMDGGDNDDFLDAGDGESGDTVLGGNGNDTADIDSADNASGVESFI